MAIRSVNYFFSMFRSQGLIWRCLVTKLHWQPLLWLRYHRRLLRPTVCDVLWRTEPDHGRLYCDGKCPTVSDSDRFVVQLLQEWINQFVSANSAPPHQMSVVFLLGYDQFLSLNIDPKKLVMGVPWYGYDYPCNNITQVIMLILKVCTLKVGCWVFLSLGICICSYGPSIFIWSDQTWPLQMWHT